MAGRLASPAPRSFPKWVGGFGSMIRLLARTDMSGTEPKAAFARCPHDADPVQGSQMGTKKNQFGVRQLDPDPSARSFSGLARVLKAPASRRGFSCRHA